MIIDIISKFILCENKQRGNLQLLKKIIGFPLEKSHYGDFVKSIFFSLERLVFLLDGEQTLFQGPFCFKTNKEENSIFWPNLWVNPFGKIWFGYSVNPIFLYFRRPCFLTGWSSNIISKFILCENKQRGNLQLLTKIIVFPLEKSQYCDFVKSIFFLV